MFCNYCGHELDSNNNCNNKFCPFQINETSQTINGFSIQEVIHFLGKNNADYYCNEFILYKEKSKFISWNFSAFLFHWIWMFYRKMNLIASIYLLATLISIIFLPPIHFIILISAGHIACGLFGNLIYRNHCFKKISSIKPMSQRISPNSYDRMLQYYGGTSIALAITMSILYSLILSILLILCVNYSVSYLDPNDNYNNPSNYYDNEDTLPYWYNTPGDYDNSTNNFDEFI